MLLSSVRLLVPWMFNFKEALHNAIAHIWIAFFARLRPQPLLEHILEPSVISISLHTVQELLQDLGY